MLGVSSAGKEASEKRCPPGAPGQDWGPGAVAAGLRGAGGQWGEVHELAAALRVPVVVVTGDPRPAGPVVQGQEADLRVISYGGVGGQPHLRGGRGFPG